MHSKIIRQNCRKVVFSLQLHGNVLNSVLFICSVFPLILTEYGVSRTTFVNLRVLYNSGKIRNRKPPYLTIFYCSVLAVASPKILPMKKSKQIFCSCFFVPRTFLRKLLPEPPLKGSFI